jgi:hypothetical protein
MREVFGYIGKVCAISIGVNVPYINSRANKIKYYCVGTRVVRDEP